MTDQNNTNRRTLLKGVGAAGTVAILGTTPAVAKGDGGKPCHKDFTCEDEDGAYVKIEFVEDDEGNCYFEEVTDTGLVTVTDWESKDGEDCDPVRVELEYDAGFTASKLMAFGGTDCETKTVDVSGDDDRLDSYESGLQNNGGDTAAISNIQFCIVEEQIFGSGEVAFGYEDLPAGGADWDVNDLVIDMNTSYKASGYSNGNPVIDQLTFDIIPQALGAGDDHRWLLDFDDDEICSGSYTLTTYDTAGDQVDQETGTLPGVITVFNSTQALFDDYLANAQKPGGERCEKPNYWANLTITFDDGCPLDIPTSPKDTGVNAEDLFFGPTLYNKRRDLYVQRGDSRLVTVPDTWDWPLGAVQIWDAYEDVDMDSAGEPDYTVDDWYDGVYDDTLTTNCNFEPNDDNEIESV